MKKLSHQHICQLYQVVETDEDIFMVLEVNFLIFVCFIEILILLHWTSGGVRYGSQTSVLKAGSSQGQNYYGWKEC